MLFSTCSSNTAPFYALNSEQTAVWVSNDQWCSQFVCLETNKKPAMDTVFILDVLVTSKTHLLSPTLSSQLLSSTSCPSCAFLFCSLAKPSLLNLRWRSYFWRRFEVSVQLIVNFCGLKSMCTIECDDV